MRTRYTTSSPSIGTRRRGRRSLESPLHFEALGEVIVTQVRTARATVTIYSPFVTVGAARRVSLAVAPNFAVDIVVRWRLLDFLTGVANLNLFDFAEELGWGLYYNHRLHLKSVICDRRMLLTGSANVTGAGLGFGPECNHETLVGPLKATESYLRYLDEVRNESIRVDRAVAERIGELVAGLQRREWMAEIEAKELELIAAESLCIQGRIFMSDLPMSRSWRQLYTSSASNEASQADRVCALYDCATLGVSPRRGEVPDAFRARVAAAFFARPFGKALAGYVDRPRRFGAVKEWIQTNCRDVPVPTRRSLTGHVQVLYDWLLELGGFTILQPRYTQVIAPQRLGNA